MLINKLLTKVGFLMKTNDRLAQSIGMNFISQFSNVLANKSTASTFNNITLKDIANIILLIIS